MRGQRHWGSTVDRGNCQPEGTRVTQHRRYYRIAGITIRVEADLPITDDTFHPRFKPFQVDGPGKDTISIRHHFSLPDLDGQDLGQRIYHKPPWAIYNAADTWTYLGILPREGESFHRVAVWNQDHTQGEIYSPGGEVFCGGHLHSLTLFTTDQILLARVLADREGCYLHAAGAVLKGQGLLFVGHSGLGKSTMATMLKDEALILCDDRIIVRKARDSFRICGTWNHSDVPIVSAASAPLRAVLFLEQAMENRLIPLANGREIVSRLLACLIKPLVTAQWWEKTLAIVEELAQVPCYIQRFDRSGQVTRLLECLV
jgi:hypothetical protein